MNNGKTILQRTSVIWNEQLTNEAERVLLLFESLNKLEV